MNILILMAGSHPSFEHDGYGYPRNLFQTKDKPVLQHVLENLAPLQNLGAKMCAIISRDEDRRFHTSQVLQLLKPGISVKMVGGKTAGALCTALLAIDHIGQEEPLIISNGDIVVDCDLCEAVKNFAEQGLDGGTIVFKDIHPRWSFVKLNESGFVVEAAEKRPISHHATTGFFYFRRGSDFLDAAFRTLLKDAHVEGAFYICPIFNEMILANKKIGVYPVERSGYHSLKTAEDVRNFDECLTEKER